MYALFWLINQLWFIVPVNSWKFRSSSDFDIQVQIQVPLGTSRIKFKQWSERILNRYKTKT